MPLLAASWAKKIEDVMDKVIGFYNECGYRIEVENEEKYRAGNNMLDSSQSAPLDSSYALSLSQIKDFCIYTGRQIAKQLGGTFAGAFYEEIETE